MGLCEFLVSFFFFCGLLLIKCHVWLQVSIPGLPNPISLSLNVTQSQPSGMIVPTLPLANTATLPSPSVVVPAPSPQPIATQIGTLNVSPANHTMLLATNTMAATGQVLSLPVGESNFTYYQKYN